jgi:hypothetical protein
MVSLSLSSPFVAFSDMLTLLHLPDKEDFLGQVWQGNLLLWPSKPLPSKYAACWLSAK